MKTDHAKDMRILCLERQREELLDVLGRQEPFIREIRIRLINNAKGKQAYDHMQKMIDHLYEINSSAIAKQAVKS